MCELHLDICTVHSHIELARVIFCEAVRNRYMTRYAVVRLGVDIPMARNPLLEDYAFVWNERFCSMPRVTIFNSMRLVDCQAEEVVGRGWGEESVNRMEMELHGNLKFTDEDLAPYRELPLITKHYILSNGVHTNGVANTHQNAGSDEPDRAIDVDGSNGALENGSNASDETVEDPYHNRDNGALENGFHNGDGES